MWVINSGAASSIIGGWGRIFISSCCALLTSFEIDCFYVCEHKYMNIPPPNYRAGGATACQPVHLKEAFTPLKIFKMVDVSGGWIPLVSTLARHTYKKGDYRPSGRNWTCRNRPCEVRSNLQCTNFCSSALACCWTVTYCYSSYCGSQKNKLIVERWLYVHACKWQIKFSIWNLVIDIEHAHLH
jgi:hypothetical protein